MTTQPTEGLKERLFAVLSNFPADGQLGNVERDTVTDLILVGFIERREAKKACPTCGTGRFDYGWFHITSGGRLFMEAMARASQEQPQ